MLPLLLTGCFHPAFRHHAQPVAPAIEGAFPAKPVPWPPALPPPVLEAPATEPAPVASLQPQPPPKPPVKHKKIGSAPSSPAGNPQLASNDSSEVSAIGQLSMGESYNLQQQTANTIAATERGLNSITRHLSDQEQKTVDHIRDFLRKAREALATGDTDGAQTLAAKARILLDELLK
jgi:ribosomal protein S20